MGTRRSIVTPAKGNVGFMDLRNAAIVASTAGLALVSWALLSGKADAQETAGLRVMTYNIQWFSEDANPERLANLRKVVAECAPTIVGVQEVQSKKALRQVFGDGWEIGMVDDPKEQQEVGIAVKKPYVLVSSDVVFPSPNLDSFFPGRRDVLRAVVQTPSGESLTVYVVHMKSRRGGRMSTDWQRESACGLLASYIAGQRNEPNVVVLGDFNDAPDDRSLNILESGDLLAKAGDNAASQRLLVNVTAPLAAEDGVTIGMSDLFLGEALPPKVAGAAADNARLRGQDYRFPQDVKVPQAFFDNVLASLALAARVKGARVHSSVAALQGSKGRTTVADDGSVTYDDKGDLASDHLPVVVDISAK